MNATAGYKIQKSRAELNKAYKQLMSILYQNEKSLLVETKKNWIKFRASNCTFEASQYEGGSIKLLIYTTCLLELTKKRIAEIKASIKDRNQQYSTTRASKPFF